MPIVSMCDKGVLKFTPEQLEERVQRLNTPDVRQKLEQRREQATAWVRKIRISHKAAIRECAGMPIRTGRIHD